MPPSDSSALIVARFLKANHLTESYEAFISEAGLPETAGDSSKDDLTLETLLEEKKTFDHSLRFEKLRTSDDQTNSWAEPAPQHENVVTILPSKSNLLSVTVQTFHDGRPLPKDVAVSFLIASTADRSLHVLTVPDPSLEVSLPTLQDSPILSSTLFGSEVLLTTSMSGQLVASEIRGQRLDSRRDHTKYIVKVDIFDSKDDGLIATAGWDNKIHVYKPTHDSDVSFTFGDPIATITLITKPESMLFLTHPTSLKPILLISRTDSNHIFYYTVDATPRLLGKQNLAPHSNAWVAFTPSSLALCPTDSSLLAVGTNSLPHMKVLIVRLLFPPYESQPTDPTPAVRTSLLDDTPVVETQASQARAALAVADREAEAIQIHSNSMAPQTAFSTPAVVWRPDGGGVWVNGDDGVIRGIEASTGKVVRKLEGHEEGSKVRCLWAGYVSSARCTDREREEDVEKQEWLVSGGFDQKLIVWKTHDH